jgi:K+-transporting ATPase KdpF subunit
MSASNVIGVTVAVLICLYLVYALLRAERF